MKDFFTIWGVILFLNQAFIFGGCFAPYCLLAALPHTGVISWFLSVFLKDNLDKEEIESTESENVETTTEPTTPKPKKRQTLSNKKGMPTNEP